MCLVIVVIVLRGTALVLREHRLRGTWRMINHSHNGHNDDDIYIDNEVDYAND